MTKQETITILNQKHQILYQWLKNHPDSKWAEGPDGKWNTGEHIVHLIQSAKALNKALWLPKFFLKYKFGVNNRANRTYDEIKNKYHHKLAAYPGLIANISKNMPQIVSDNKNLYISKLKKEQTTLSIKFQKWKEKDLDIYLLPHPLLGKMTIREIVLWTAYHTEHHYKILKANY